MSIRNGTALAILLSIAFVLVAVASRGVLPSLAGNESQSGPAVSTDWANVTGSIETSSTSQISQQAVLGIGATPSTATDNWNDGTAGSNAYDEYEDHHNADDDDTHSSDHDDDRNEDHENDDDDD